MIGCFLCVVTSFLFQKCHSLLCPDLQVHPFPDIKLSLTHPSVQHFERILSLAHKSSDRCHTWKCSSPDLTHQTCQYCFPSLLIGGLSKCGTSALYAKLATHPSIGTYWDKEVNIFNARNSIPPYFQNFSTLEAWLGPPAANSASLQYLDGSAGTSRDLQAIALLKKYSPATKVIFMVRDTKARFTSWLAMGAHDHNADEREYSVMRGKTLLHALHRAVGNVTVQDMMSPAFIDNIVYHGPMMAYFLAGPLLLPWIQHMKDKIMIIDHAELLHSPLKVLRRIETWLGIAPHTYDSNTLRTKTNVHGNWGWFNHTLNAATARNKRHRHHSFGEDLDQYLIDLIEKDNCVFQKLLGWTPQTETISHRGRYNARRRYVLR